MGNDPEEIVQNAQNGDGPCAGCSAQEASNSDFVNPGLSNPNGELVFVTEEPRHLMNWDAYETWTEYNEAWIRRFANARGGRFIERLLALTDLTLGDVWVADSIKCPTKRDDRRDIPACETDEAFRHCRTYLEREFEYRDPNGIVTLGKEATIRSLKALGVPNWQAERTRVTKEYGPCTVETPYPMVISLHWAQRAVAESEWVPVVQEAIADLVS